MLHDSWDWLQPHRHTELEQMHKQIHIKSVSINTHLFWLICLYDHSTVIIFLIFLKNLFRGLPVPEAEMLYMQEVEKMEGYGQETFQAKVGLWKPLDHHWIL